MGLRLLLAEDSALAAELAQTLDVVNRQRQTVEAGITAEAMAMAQAQMEAGHGVILLAQEGWHPGVVGIVAGRVKEKFNRPALVGGHHRGAGQGLRALGAGGGPGRGGHRGAPERAARHRRRTRHGGGVLAARDGAGRAARLPERAPGRLRRHCRAQPELVLDGALARSRRRYAPGADGGAARAVWHRQCRAALRAAARAGGEDATASARMAAPSAPWWRAKAAAG